MITEQLIWIAITLWIVGVIVASLFVFAALYMGDEDRLLRDIRDTTNADDN